MRKAHKISRPAACIKRSSYVVFTMVSLPIFRRWRREHYLPCQPRSLAREKQELAQPSFAQVQLPAIQARKDLPQIGKSEPQKHLPASAPAGDGRLQPSIG
jgi:hypothetical protein